MCNNNKLLKYKILLRTAVFINPVFKRLHFPLLFECATENPSI